MFKRIGKVFETIKVKWDTPLHIEFNVTDFCNLNCKGCSHYSPLAPEEYEGLESLERSMKLISETKNAQIIKEVYLIGGETLLYPGLKKAMVLARKYFPWAKISIFTNGLLIPKMDNEFWEICRREKCVIGLTRYPLKFDYDKVEALCREREVEVEVFGDRGKDNSFFKLPLDPKKSQNKWLSHFRCGAFGCVTVDCGKIFPCSQSACIRHINERFGTAFTWEKGDYIKVEDLKDASEILKLRNRPVPFCAYCRRWEPVKYGPSKRTISEWT